MRQHLARLDRVEAVGVRTCPRLPCGQLARRHKFRASRYSRPHPGNQRPNVLCLTEHLAAAFKLFNTLRLGCGDPLLPLLLKPALMSLFSLDRFPDLAYAAERNRKPS